MKTSFQSIYRSLILAIVASSLVAGSTAKAGANGAYRDTGPADNAQLVVWRAADFGYWITIGLYIDGMQVTSLSQNESYKALVRPGEHVLSIITSPSPYGKTRVTYHRVQMKRGETYTFTTLWREAQLPVLEPGRPRIASTGW